MAYNRALPSNPELTGIAVAAPVPGMIAEQVLPDVKVTKENFNWTEFDVGQGTTVPDTEVGRTSSVKRVEFGGTPRTSSVKDQGLESPVPLTDEAADSGFSPMDMAAEKTSQLVTLARELRTRDTVFSSANYLPAQITAYANGDGWGDPAVNPLVAFDQAKADSIVDFNTLTLGKDGWAALRKNPFMVKAARPANTSGEGRLSIEEVKDLLELDDILIGKAMLNIAKPGQPPQLARAWGTHASLTFIERIVKSTETFTYGATFRLTGKRSWNYFDEKVGLEGAEVVRVGERLIEQVVAKQAGWLFQNAATG